MRLAKFLAHAGVASRRAAEELVRAGRVTIAGEMVDDPARDVQPGADVALDGAPVGGPEPRVVYLLHKPPGVVSTAHDPQGRKTVVDLVPAGRRLYPVGRLDADASGLILLTNDGELANRLMHPRYEVARTYRVTVGNPPVRPPTLRALADGVELSDGRTLPATVRRVSPDVLELTIHEGRNRQVKRMCAEVGHPVKALVRVRFGPLALGDLAPGRWRRLGAGDVAELSGDAER